MSWIAFCFNVIKRFIFPHSDFNKSVARKISSQSIDIRDQQGKVTAFEYISELSARQTKRTLRSASNVRFKDHFKIFLGAVSRTSQKTVFYGNIFKSSFRKNALKTKCAGKRVSRVRCPGCDTGDLN